MKIRTVPYGATLAAFMFVIPAAKAAPVTLSCGPTSANRVGSLFVHFDEGAGSAGEGTADNPRYDGPATFSDTEIQWKWTQPENHWHTYELNRMTGELDETTRSSDPNRPFHDVFYCAAAQKQF